MSERAGRVLAALAVFALALCILEWIWLSWEREKAVAALQKEIDYLRSDLVAFQNERLPGDTGSRQQNEISRDRLYNALDRLGSKNLLSRYQAGLTVKEYGKRAVPELVELVWTGTDRSRSSALFILADMEPPECLPDLRELLKTYFAGKLSREKSVRDCVMPDEDTAVAALGILAGMKDSEALPLFEKGLDHSEESVRLAALAGVRRLEANDLLPELVARLGKENKLIDGQIKKAIAHFWQSDPDEFFQKFSGLQPASRFTVLGLLAQDRSAAASRVLRSTLNDSDPRVALGAVRALAKRGDPSGVDVAMQMAQDSSLNELQDIAEQIVNQIREPSQPGE